MSQSQPVRRILQQRLAILIAIFLASTITGIALGMSTRDATFMSLFIGIFVGQVVAVSYRNYLHQRSLGSEQRQDAKAAPSSTSK